MDLIMPVITVTGRVEYSYVYVNYTNIVRMLMPYTSSKC